MHDKQGIWGQKTLPLCTAHCSLEQPNFIVHSKACSQGMSVNGKQCRGAELNLWSSTPLCVASHWLTSLSCKPCAVCRVVCKHDIIHKTESRILHCYQRRTEPWPQVTCTENVLKFRRVVFELCEWTDRHIGMLIAVFALLLGAK